MKRIILLAFLSLILSYNAFCQSITCGQYLEMTLAYNPQTKILTGFYNSGTGDDGHGEPLFTCIFYLEGKVVNGKATISTYFPPSKLKGETDDIIPGTFTYRSATEAGIKLKEEHGGCWNVEHFADSVNRLVLTKKENWIAVKYAVIPKAYFYKDDKTTQRKGYIIAGDVVYIDTEKDGWAHCTYVTDKWKKITGWMRSTDLNVLK